MQGKTAIANILKLEGVESFVCFPNNAIIEAAAEIGERAQDGEVRVRLEREANQVGQRGEREIQLLKVVGERVLRIHVERRALLARERLERDALAAGLAVLVTKIVHGASYACAQRGIQI